jgi:hypothetical protein
LRKVVASGDVGARGGQFDANLNVPAIRLNEVGQVGFLYSSAVYVSSAGGSPALALAPGMSLPAPFIGKTIGGLSFQASGFSDSGSVAAGVQIPNMDQYSAIVKSTPSGLLEVVVARNDLSTIGDPLWGFSNVSINGAGDVSFNAIVTLGAQGSTYGLFLKPAGHGVQTVAVNGRSAPASPGGTWVLYNYSRLYEDGRLYFESELLNGNAGWGGFLWNSQAVSRLMSTADPLPPGSRVSLRNLFMGGAGTYTMFMARLAGGGNSLWVLNTLTRETTRVAADGDLAPGSPGARLAIASTLNQWVMPTGGAVFPAMVMGGGMMGGSVYGVFA